VKNICRGASILLVALLCLYGTPAGAEEVAPSTHLVAIDDGEPCTGVPDAVPGIFDFSAACVAHDACYGQGVDRLACDVQFRQDLLASCVALHPATLAPGRLLCTLFAELYFAGVRLFGGLFFPS
jgi:hypothetical protein